MEKQQQTSTPQNKLKKWIIMLIIAAPLLSCFLAFLILNISSNYGPSASYYTPIERGYIAGQKLPGLSSVLCLIILVFGGIIIYLKHKQRQP